MIVAHGLEHSSFITNHAVRLTQRAGIFILLGFVRFTVISFAKMKRHTVLSNSLAASSLHSVLFPVLFIKAAI